LRTAGAFGTGRDRAHQGCAQARAANPGSRALRRGMAARGGAADPGRRALRRAMAVRGGAAVAGRATACRAAEAHYKPFWL
ncbi:MAG: hypothetical protein ACRDFS_00550, partial [Chloroflexota bacterium]